MYRQGNTSENLQRVEPAKGKSDDIEIIEIDEDEDCDAVVAKDPTPSEVPVDSDCALEVEDSEDDSLTLGVSSQNIPVECILSAEEAFFLAFVCGYLEVRHRDSSRALHLEELWRYFTMRDSNFVFKYAAYHRYRCKGWIVRDGLRFGGDFLLYKDGPSLYHASYLVIVNPPDDAGRFLDFQGRMRLAKNVGKQLLLCHVYTEFGGMGCDGGTIPKRDELVRTKKKPEKKDKESAKRYKWRHCSVSQEQLRKPVVACQLGRFYNKEALLEALLNKETKNPVISHIKSLKDIREVRFSTNPAFTDATSETAAPYICPVTSLEMNGVIKFVLIWKCGCTISERALKEAKSSTCHVCGGKFEDPADVVVLNPEEDSEEEAENRRKMEQRKAASRHEKKQKNIADDPNATEAYKSLFTSHKDARNKITPHWIQTPMAAADDSFVNLDALTVNQLGQLKQSADAEAQLFKESCEHLKMAQQKFLLSAEAVTKLMPEKSDAMQRELLIPLTSSMYVPGMISDTEHVLVDIGTGYYAEMPLEKARSYFDRKVSFVGDQLEKVQSVAVQKFFFRQKLGEALESKLSDLRKTQQQSS
ncbi:unnamed protein product [Cyprideis torosa]|uniref:Replication termination factor 2 n=1 Tax=Cyprideis torosa TaxID=163714 RepID=A0A7R8ZKY7_9CRUS|nr:unnamed protein product [Cyprideis torosa]CAG0881247.1 unnamed protein product [Cyprideis torosa]